jgi:hypothetical protein
MMSCAGQAACMGEIRNAYKILVKNLKGRDHSEEPRHRREDNITMDLR